MHQIIKDVTRLLHIQQAGQRITGRIGSQTIADFIADEDLQDIVVRQLIIIGEALVHISTTTKQHYSHIDWRAAIGLRNFVVHEYFRVDLPTVWQAAIVELPALLAELDIIWQDLQSQLPGTTSV